MISALEKLLLLCILSALAMSLPAECGVLDLGVRGTDGSPAAGIVFQIFPGRVGVDDDAMPFLLVEVGSDKMDFSSHT